MNVREPGDAACYYATITQPRGPFWLLHELRAREDNGPSCSSRPRFLLHRLRAASFASSTWTSRTSPSIGSFGSAPTDPTDRPSSDSGSPSQPSMPAGSGCRMAPTSAIRSCCGPLPPARRPSPDVISIDDLELASYRVAHTPVPKHRSFDPSSTPTQGHRAAEAAADAVPAAPRRAARHERRRAGLSRQANASATRSSESA